MIESQIAARVLPSKCREAVKVLLQEVYGYEDFRNLEVYDDLFKGKEKLQLSQGQLIEEVIMEAEKGIKGDSSVHNLLDRKSTRLNSSHRSLSRMPSSA